VCGIDHAAPFQKFAVVEYDWSFHAVPSDNLGSQSNIDAGGDLSADTATSTPGSAEDTARAIPPTVSRANRTRWKLSAIAGAILAVTIIVRSLTLPAVSFCWFRSMTGLPCPGCGLTRSVFAISGGDFAAAWQFNPFGYLAYGVLIVMLLLPLLGRVAPKTTAFIESSWFINTFIVVSVAGLMVFGLFRLALYLS
jgi:hypothetical protein